MPMSGSMSLLSLCEPNISRLGALGDVFPCNSCVMRTSPSIGCHEVCCLRSGRYVRPLVREISDFSRDGSYDFSASGDLPAAAAAPEGAAAAASSPKEDPNEPEAAKVRRQRDRGQCHVRVRVRLRGVRVVHVRVRSALPSWSWP